MHSFATTILAITQAVSSPPSTDLTQRIFSTVDQSEWCPAGNVQLDLRSGDYSLTPGVPVTQCMNPQIERPVMTGRLDAYRLSELRNAFGRAISEGMLNSDCSEGRRPRDIVISNGGTPILVLTTGAKTIAAHDELSCWSKAAIDLHRSMGSAFDGKGRR